MKAHRLARLALKSLWLHRLRSLLTVLGIVFGAGSVVAMLAIVEGANREAQEQIRLMGSRNLILASVEPPAGERASERTGRVKEYGMDREDLERIRLTIPSISRIVARRDAVSEVRFGTRRYGATLAGTEPAYAEVANLRVAAGRFLHADDGVNRRAVCVLGDEVARRLFLSADPIGHTVRAGPDYFLVVGVLARRGEGTGGTAGVGGESDSLVIVPIETMQDRKGETIVIRSTGSWVREKIQYHRVTVEASEVEDVPMVAAALRSLVQRWHPKDDVRLTVPLELLRQAEEIKRIFTVLFGSIAAISLVVGGIGITNITLASVVERTREIGVRRALGARRRDVVLQFLAETVMLAVVGGLIGLPFGVLIPLVAEAFTDVTTIVTPSSLVLAFGVSGGVGVLAGLYPASRAAGLDPVEALRHE